MHDDVTLSVTYAIRMAIGMKKTTSSSFNDSPQRNVYLSLLITSSRQLHLQSATKSY